MYEPSSLGRNMLSLIVLLFLVPMSFQFSVREIFNNYILLFSLAMAFASSFMPPSLTLVALIGVSAFLSVVVMSSSYLLTAFASFRLKAGKSYVWSLCTLILLAICASFVLPMFLSPRRVSNSLFLIDSLRSFDLDNLLVLGGGRYLSNLLHIKAHLLLDSIFLDLC